MFMDAACKVSRYVILIALKQPRVAGARIQFRGNRLGFVAL